MNGNMQGNVLPSISFSKHFSSLLFKIRHRKSSGKGIQGIYSIVNVYLWLHGIGFSKGMSFKRENILTTVISIIFLAIVESNFIYIMYAYGMNFYRFGLEQKKGELVTFLVSIVNFYIRLLFYTRRRMLKNIIIKLSKLYSLLCKSKKSETSFKGKIVVFLVIHETLIVLFLVQALNKYRSFMSEIFWFGDTNLPVVVPFFFSCVLLVYFVEASVTSYFCLVCFALKEILIEFKEQLHRKNDAENLLTLHKKISNMINCINSDLHPFLLATFIHLLLATFRESYYALFLGHMLLSEYFKVVLTFSQFVFICVSSSSVMCAAAAVENDVQYLPFDASSPRGLRFLAQSKNGFAKFKILNSILIDSSLILNASGVLLTYGILFATFNAAKDTSEGNF